jgi:hypothetical protein
MAYATPRFVSVVDQKRSPQPIALAHTGIKHVCTYVRSLPLFYPVDFNMYVVVVISALSASPLW